MITAARANPFAGLEAALDWLPMTVAAIGVLLLIGVILTLVRQYRERDDKSLGDHEMLSTIEGLRQHGELSEEEFRSIKERLAERMKTSLEVVKTGRESAETASGKGDTVDAAGPEVAFGETSGQPIQMVHSIQSESPSGFEDVPEIDANPEQRRQKEEPAETETRMHSGDCTDGSAE